MIGSVERYTSSVRKRRVSLWRSGVVRVIAAAFLLWRRPAMLRMLISVVVLAEVGHSIFRLASDLDTPTTSGAAPTNGLTIVLEALSTAASFLPYLALLLFAFLAVKREDIDRLAPDDRSATG